jgi:beta-lactamase class C
MSRRTLAGIAKACACICLWQQAAFLRADAAVEALASEFSSYFQQHVSFEDITGAAFVIASPEGILDLGTAGHTDAGRTRPIDPDTVFRVASVSKTFAAGLAGVLVSEGRFKWDDRVVDHVPGFRVKGDSSHVQILHLLGQSTGLMPHAYDNLIEDGVSLDRIQEKFRELEYLCQPGACYSYQNSIFSLIQPVIENTTDQSYAHLMEARIFRPLDMKTASVGYQSLVENPNHALPHVKSRGKWTTIRVKPNYYQVAPAAGVNASVQDMGKWLVAQMGGQPGVIDPEIIDTLTRPRVETKRDTRRRYWREVLSEAHYGLGWRIYQMGEHRIAYHSGWVSGYRADIAWSEDYAIGIAILMNVEGGSISQLTTTFWRMAFDQLQSTRSGDPRLLASRSGAGQSFGATTAR